jgi:hypothetical protein
MISWSIAVLISNILLLNSSFNWVRREANGVAHALAKFVPSPKSTVFVCNSSFSSSVRDVWRLDSVSVSGLMQII